MDVTDHLRRTGPSILLILLVGSVVYANTFQVPFILDDEWAIVNNPSIKNPAYMYTPALWYQEYAGRIVTLLTFSLNYRLGGLDVTGYHAVNLLIHLATAVLVYALLRLTFRTPYFQRSGPWSKVQGETVPPSSAFAKASADRPFSLQPAAFIPLFAALLFVAHPVQTQAVTYIVQRMTSLTTMFYLLSVVLYVQARLHLAEIPPGPPLPKGGVSVDGGEKGASPFQNGGSRGIFVLLLAGSVLSAILAMKSKEIAVTLPAAIVLYEVCFFRGDWKRRLLCLLPLLATFPIVPMTVFFADQAPAESMGETLAGVGKQVQAQSSLPSLDYLCTQLRVIITYLRLLVLPVNQNLDYDYPVYTTFFTPPVFLSFLLLTALFSFALYLWVTSRREPRASRLISFGILWFFLTLAVESSIVPLPDVIFEHRLYLPLFGAAAAAATAFWLLAAQFSRQVSGKLTCLIAALLVLGLGVAAFQRNQVWGDAVRLWQDVVAKSPDKARPYNNLGVALNRAGRSPEAIEVLSRAIALDPLHPDAYNNLGRAYIVNGQSSAALPVLKTAIRISPEFKGAYINLAAALNQLRQFRETKALVEQNLGLLGDQVEAHYHLGVAYAFLGEREAARRQLEIVSRSNAADLVADLLRLLKQG